MVDFKKLSLKEKNSKIKETEIHIKNIKDFFESNLSKELNLIRVSAPLFVKTNSGINDNLSGSERPVAFDTKSLDSELQIVQSLAKWKRIALGYYGFNPGEGLYTDMNAIRRDEDLDNLHSIYVDQWDWEKIILEEERTLDTLKNTVNSIYKVFKCTEEYVSSFIKDYEKILPDDIYFISSQELEDLYPNMSSKERENTIAKEKKAVFIIGIGDLLNSGEKHDHRSPDYDDWNLNGDILFWYSPLNCALELSSMGIRVNKASLLDQLEKSNTLERKELPYHKSLINNELPFTIGGGIGQSRICMYFLRKLHIGEVQSSVWSEDILMECTEKSINLL
ncbi:aspartate--ammonia ligase [Hathewaya massiliensis]|uniref:aspartate--ammonia ligase n=1 Tax=Hathewaya massiliensis TaxID=1964382 RepID=UPI001156EAE9|nr:aspartate--ammonia ligase [Hathewaya massiliensis]